MPSNLKQLSDVVLMIVCYHAYQKEYPTVAECAAHDELIERGLQGEPYWEFAEWYAWHLENEVKT